MNDPQVVTGNEVKNKKRKIISLDVMYMGSSSTEETPKRKKHKQNSETQQAEPVSPTPKRKKTGDAYIEGRTAQEYKEISAKKKQIKEESLQEADDVIADDSSSAALHREDSEKVKISHKSKDYKRPHEDEGFTEGASYNELTNLKGRTKKKKKKLKKDSGESILENSLVEELFTPETLHATGKKKKRKGGGGLQEEDVESNLHCGFTEELISERKYPDRFETPEQVDEHVRKKKKKKRKDESQEADDITVNDANIRKSCEGKNLNLHLCGIPLLEAVRRESADIEHRKSLKKKPKKDHREHVLEDSIVEELLTSEIHHKSKKKTKRKDGGDESHRQDCFTGELVTQRKYQEGSETVEQVRESVDRAEDTFEEQLLILETQHSYKKKRKGGGSFQEEDDESNLQHGFTEELISERKYPDGSETPEQVDESVRKKKKKKKIKDDPLEADDIIVDGAKIKKSCKVRDLNGLHGDEGLPEDVLNGEPADIGHRPSLKKKPKKDHRECILEDSLVQESLTPETQRTSKKKKKKHKGGGDESHRLDCCPGELVTKRNHQGGSETIEQVDESVDQAEERLVEELLVPETQYAYKKKKKWKNGGGFQENCVTQALWSTKNCPEQVGESVDRAEKRVKKKKIKDEPQQEADDTTIYDASSLIGLREDEPSCSKLNDTEDRLSRKKKMKSKKAHREHPLEDNLVEESLNPDAQHTSKKKTKRNDGGGEIHRQLGFSEELVTYQGGSENMEQMAETVELAEVRVKKKKAKKNKHSSSRVEMCEILAKETHLEDDDASADSTEISQSSQSRTVENVGKVEEDTEQPSTSRRRRPQTSAPTDVDPNPTTQDENETIHNEGDNRSGSSDKRIEKPHVRRRKTVLASIQEDDVALLKEYFPQMTKAKLSRLVIEHELERIRIAKQNGIMFRAGHFTFDEDEQIKKNVQTFMSQVGIDSAEMLFHPYKFPDVKKTIEEMKRKFNFRQRIAEGLHRVTKDVYDRGAKLHELNTSKGRFSEQEVKLLKKYHEIYGNNWRTIGTLLNRGSQSSQLKASQIRREVNLGKWSLEETNLLIAAVKQHVLASLRKQRKNGKEPVTVPKEKLYKGISWVRIEEKVETRNWTHCKRKWFDLILKRMNDFINPFHGLLGIQSSMKIIKWMRDSEVKEYGDVKWDKLSNFIGNVPPFLTQNRFIMLKNNVPEWRTLRLYEIVDRLSRELLPELEDKLSAAQEPPIEPEKKDEFLISEMFQEYSDYEENWNLPEYLAEVGGGGGHCRVPSY